MVEAEGVGVSDEQLDEWEEDTLASVRAFGSARNYERLLAVIGEVRASRARQSEAVSALAEFTNDAVEDEWECPSCRATTRARMTDRTSINSAAAGAALTGTDNQSTEETR